MILPQIHLQKTYYDFYYGALCSGIVIPKLGGHLKQYQPVVDLLGFTAYSYILYVAC